MYENDLLIDVGTAVVLYSSTGIGREDWRSSLWLVRPGGGGGGGAARGDGHEEEMKRVERGVLEARYPDPVAPLHLSLFNYLHDLQDLHIQTGYAYANAPRSPVYASQLIRMYM